MVHSCHKYSYANIIFIMK